ncbi:LPXTG cell wall anchor domain-containing protein [Phytoactinopolyspora alkaliphila]|uniref:LPXTG cell wall anchor domain-containing protein n=1 Tax=Phytoactinopolyspora alkaliphila TaxID=1783498 RepID=A0A6N9YLE7_9ACTN|nr:neocarzinostatin apoprotein domain-containing protein [Phytoactinopolyspora alkaliphila]NED95737.1 LPXTG cell wall anchor domain-containing protein [Phytoactinopolyspora alkaliphila]
MHDRIPRRPRRAGSAVVALSLAIGGPVALAAPAAAVSGSGPEGQSVTVSKRQGLADGETITVQGSGFDLGKGIYVVLCVDNGPGQAPSPCLGGVDMEGSGGSSAWISSNPPSYGEGLAQPFEEVGGKGSFNVQLTVAASDEFTDCLDASAAPRGCVVGTRADHTRTADRSADVRIPVTFGTDEAGGESTDDESGETSDETSGDAPGSASGTAGADGSADDGPAEAAGTGADDLAATGSSTTALTAGAVALAAAGGILLAARRRPFSP